MKIQFISLLCLLANTFLCSSILSQNIEYNQYVNCNYNNNNNGVANIILKSDNSFQYNSRAFSGCYRGHSEGTGNYEIIDNQIYFHFDSSRTELKRQNALIKSSYILDESIILEDSSIQFLVTDKTGEPLIGASLVAFNSSKEISARGVSDIDGLIYINQSEFTPLSNWHFSYTGFKNLIIEENLVGKFVHIKLSERLVGLDAMGVVYIEGQTWVGKFSEDRIELPFRSTSDDEQWNCYQKIE